MFKSLLSVNHRAKLTVGETRSQMTTEAVRRVQMISRSYINRHMHGALRKSKIKNQSLFNRSVSSKLKVLWGKNLHDKILHKQEST